MAKSEITKKYIRLSIIFSIISAFLLIAPLAYYIAAAFIASTLVIEKIALSATIFLVVMLTALCTINKWTFRSKIWILVLVFFLVLENILAMIVVFGITQIADELIAAPLSRYFRAKANINLEIDKRMV